MLIGWVATGSNCFIERVRILHARGLGNSYDRRIASILGRIAFLVVRVYLLLSPTICSRFRLRGRLRSFACALLGRVILGACFIGWLL